MGQERYRSIGSGIFRGVFGVMLVFDISSYQSFLNLDYWTKIIYQNCTDHVVVLLVGNKCDLSKFREVQYDDIIDFAKKKNFSYIEVSAKENLNVYPYMGLWDEGIKTRRKKTNILWMRNRYKNHSWG